MLTAKTEKVDKILGLELGADDYATKPFSFRVLHARIKTLLRCPPTIKTEIEAYAFGDVQVDFQKHELTKSDEPFQPLLSAKQGFR